MKRTINKRKLDEHLIKLLEDFSELETEYIKIKTAVMQAKADLQTLEAKLYQEIREKASQLGKKLTEKMVEVEIKNNPEYQELYSNYLKLQKKEKELEAQKETLYMERFVLENLSALFSAQYFMK